MSNGNDRIPFCRERRGHGVMSFFARPSALVILVALLVAALVRARVAGFGGTDLDKIAALALAVIGATLAYVVSLPVVHLVAHARPFVVVPQAVVLVTKPAGFSFPNEHTVIAGALATGIWLGRARLLAALATLVALVLALAVVYTGVAYPGDTAAGLLIGTLVTLALYPIAIGSLRELVHLVARSPLKFLVGGGRRKALGPGPAARPEQVGDSGTVRVLAPDEVRTVRAMPSARTRATGTLRPDETGTVRICRLGKLEPVPERRTSELRLVIDASRCEAHDEAGVAQRKRRRLVIVRSWVRVPPPALGDFHV